MDDESSGDDPFVVARQAASQLEEATGVPRHDVVVVLGTGLGPVADALGARESPIDLLKFTGFAPFGAIGHRTIGWSLTIGAHRVLVVAGRAHLYEGYSASQVAHVIRVAAASGCQTAVLTCAIGALRPEFEVGSVVVVKDHINLTGQSPLTGIRPGVGVGPPFVDMADAWSPRLRERVRSFDPSLKEAVYVQMPGPQLESPAELTMVRQLGADLVGMSTVVEAIAARHLEMEVLGLAVVTNGTSVTATSTEAVSIQGVVEVAGGAAGRVGQLIEAVLREP